MQSFQESLERFFLNYPFSQQKTEFFSLLHFGKIETDFFMRLCFRKERVIQREHYSFCFKVMYFLTRGAPRARNSTSSEKILRPVFLTTPDYICERLRSKMISHLSDCNVIRFALIFSEQEKFFHFLDFPGVDKQIVKSLMMKTDWPALPATQVEPDQKHR